ncbi:hypothetical protein [Amphibacillus cookii]|uniref:hypothetical protein n=1 Tax=Amphibacillus cookii TaxID=767787 RepID=UPI00195DE6A6|nr:hypothetical protein [Amphibacillus cookii]MBM7542369.1 hypothetical protein [Amphibacillus cookii]
MHYYSAYTPHHPTFPYPYPMVPQQGNWRTADDTQNARQQRSLSKGNICAYVPEDSVAYQKLKIMHYPSEDYKRTHPKGWLHTSVSEQRLESYRSFYQ